MTPVHQRSNAPDEVRIARLEWALEVMAHWLVQTQTGFGTQDADGIVAILRGEQDHNVPALKDGDSGV